jgi:hypothetical protein
MTAAAAPDRGRRQVTAGWLDRWLGPCPDHARPLVLTGVALACTAAVAQTLLYVVNVALLDGRVALFELEEGAVVTWAAVSATFAAAAFALVVGFVEVEHRARAAALAAGVAFISFDDAANLHERLAFRIADTASISASFAQVIWPALYMPLLVACALLLTQLARPTAVAARLTVVGLVLLAVAIGLEVAGIAFERAGADPDAWPRMTVIALEEALEVVGWIVIATGVAARLVTLAAAHDDP